MVNSMSGGKQNMDGWVNTGLITSGFLPLPNDRGSATPFSGRTIMITFECCLMRF